ncbi:DMT family transporter [Brachybacterium kimchii]|uniref:Multidrug efflux SMR transporter n=1 Tax=Brachybacterium kimchii TaxID=2942909 RepID=A0ABY4N3S6_9MICO|nr:multidrug efflux SMR transporter [Brachybacterium kimchii]UQN29208.1 multidrug efflux SMR transporter [Brachybacterium kimchii]
MSAEANAPSRGWTFLLLAIGAEVTASLSLKGALERPALYALVLVGYVGAFIALALVLREGMPLGVAYGVWGASGVALTAIMSLILFGEALTAPMIIGIVLVIAGVLCVELGSPAPPASGVGPESDVGPEFAVWPESAAGPGSADPLDPLDRTTRSAAPEEER